MNETTSLMMDSPPLMTGSTLITGSKCESMNNYRKGRSLISNSKNNRVGDADNERATNDSILQPTDVRLK